MARALLGYVGNTTNNEQVLAMQVARLRRRVAELEAELAELRASRHAELDIELHELHSIAEVPQPV
jgi:cell division protein FtsB